MVEVLLGSFILVVALAALLGAFLGQSLLNANARNLTIAANDASRVMEQIRQQNVGDNCTTTPTVQPPTGTSWDAWLESASGGGKSFTPNPTLNELVAVTCQNENGTAYCGPTQVGSGEWVRDNSIPPPPLYDPLRVSVAVCWRDSRQRVVGECIWNGDLVAQNGANGPNADNRVIESPAMLTTLVTCRG